MDEEARAAALRAQEANRFAFRSALARSFRGSASARKGLYDRMKAIAPPYDIGNTDDIETEDFILGKFDQNKEQP